MVRLDVDVKRALAAALFCCALSCVPKPVAKPDSPQPDRPAVPSPESATAPDAGAAVDAGAEPTAAAEPTEPKPLTLAIGGDVTLGYHHEEWFDQQVAAGKTRDEMFAYGFTYVKPLVPDTDLFVVNLECPFTARGEKIAKNFNFRARPELVGSLIAGGVDAVSLANNHMMDYGAEGLLDTIATLDEQRIPHFGAGRTLAEARKPAIVEWQGVKVAFLGYFFLGANNIEPAIVIATENTPGVAGHYSDPDVMERMIREDVALAKTQADLVIPFFHWGKERYFLPQDYQVRLGHAAVEAGAAMVLGSHPHVLEGMELYRSVPVLYSLGNFVFGGNWNPKPKETALVKMRFSRAGYLSGEIIPMKSDRYPEFPAQPYVPEPEVGAQILKMLSLYSANFDQPLPELPAPPPLYWVEPPPGKQTAAR